MAKVTTYTLTNLETGERWSIAPGSRYTLGRDIANHLVVNSPSVAKRHLELWVEGDGVVLHDAGRAQQTRVGDESVDGEVRRLGRAAEFATGKVPWRLTVGGAPAPTPESFSLDRALQRHREGAEMKLPIRRWTYGWKGINGLPIPGILGEVGARFWFRAIMDLDFSSNEETFAAFRERADLLEPLTVPEAEALTEDAAVYGEEFGALTFTWREMFGEDAVIDFVQSSYDWKAYGWTGPLKPTPKVRTAMSQIFEEDGVMALARAAGIEAEGLEVLVKMGRGRPPSYRFVRDVNMTPEEMYEFGVRHQRIDHMIAQRVATEGSDSLVHRFMTDAIARKSTSRLDLFASRMFPEYVPDVIALFDAPPLDSAVMKWLAGGGRAAVDKLVAVAGEHPQLVVEALGTLDQQLMGVVWDDLPAGLAEAVESRFGRPTSLYPVATQAQWWPNLKRMVERGVDPNWGYKPREPPPQLVTKSGYALDPTATSVLLDSVCRFEYDTLGSETMDYDELFELNAHIEPRSAARIYVWGYQSSQNYGQSEVTKNLPLFAFDDAGIGIAYEYARESGHDLDALAIFGTADLVPMVTWCLLTDTFVPWRLEQELPLRDGQRMDRWMAERMPARLPSTAGILMRDWLDATMVRGSRWTFAEWTRLVRETWLGSVADLLVWVAGDTAFRPDADLLLDVHGDDVVISPEAEVHLVHPCELGDERHRWADHLGDFEIAQPFDQFASTLQPASVEEVQAWIGERQRSTWLGGGWDSVSSNFDRAEGEPFIRERNFGRRGIVRVYTDEGVISRMTLIDHEGSEADIAAADPFILATVADALRRSDDV